MGRRLRAQHRMSFPMPLHQHIATPPLLQEQHLFVTLASDLGQGWSLFRLSKENKMFMVELPPEDVAPESPEFTACAAAQVRAITFRNLLVCGRFSTHSSRRRPLPNTHVLC